MSGLFSTAFLFILFIPCIQSHALEKFPSFVFPKTPCTRNLTHETQQSNRFVFQVDSFPLYFQSQLGRIIEIFDKGSALQGETNLRVVNRGKSIQVLNPITFDIRVTLSEEEISWKFSPVRYRSFPNPRKLDLTQKDIELFLKPAQRIIDLIQANDSKTYSKLRDKKFEIHFFGVRYFAKRGQRLAGVIRHNHGKNVLYQGIVILQKPEDLVGGHVLLTEGVNSEIRVPMKDGVSIVRRFQRRSPERIVKLPVNRLLTFEALHSVHATQSFRLPNDREEETSFRDILGIEIREIF